MKKRVSEYNKKNRILNKLGMTYVELLCALSLLSLIVVMFTPMLLSSYETLYKAGERVEGVYDSKTEIEEGLAERFSEVTITIDGVSFATSLEDNASALFQSMNVKLKKVVSSLQEGLETAFGTARASVDIISPRIVYDDQDNHDVVIQTTGIEYSKVKFGTYTTDEALIEEYERELESVDEKGDYGTGYMLIEVIVPDKTGDIYVDEPIVYKAKNLATVSINGTAVSAGSELTLSNLSNDGRITLNVSGVPGGDELDFTQSPVRISVYYVNTRGKVKSTSDYLTIEPPTMMLAGLTNSNVDYYTSSGVEKSDVITAGDNKTTIQTTYSLTAQARKMRTANSGLLGSSDAPGSTDTKIQTITWVASDENSSLRPYYVMAGTNSKVYRMYNFNKATTLSAVFTESTGSTVSATNTKDATTILSDGTQAHPSFWSGEISDQYSFHTMYKSSTYGAADDNDVDCSAPQTDDDIAGSTDLVGTQYNKFDKNLRYSMLFCSFGTGYTYASQMSRKVSYVLTEAGDKSYRIAGKKLILTQFTGYHVPWEEEFTKYAYGTFVANTSAETAVYFAAYKTKTTEGISYASNPHTDMHMAYVRLNSYTNINPLELGNDSTTYSRFVNSGDFWSPYGESEESIMDTTAYRNYTNYVSTDYSCNVNITSSVYLPGAGSAGQGQVIYFGTVPSYALMQQRSDVEKGNTKMYNTNTMNDYRSLATVYLLCGSQGNGTTIYKNASSSYYNTVDVHNVMRSDIETGTTATVTTVDKPETFYTKANDGETYKYEVTDLEFTFGYCSRWRMAVGDVTYNGTEEETKSYEKYYTSTSTTEKYTRTPGTYNTGTEDNLYYNVWFPGEYYNLTQTATCDEVTVACGYTVSGSTFMEQSHLTSGYYGTALGSVYNDAVLAIYTEEGSMFTDGLEGKGEQNVIFENCLYYKSPNFIADTVTNGVTSTLHARENMRFTAVGLFALTNEVAGTKDYYAVYGDNHGNAYYSIVASSSVAEGEPMKDENGNYVYDESGEIVMETKESNVNVRSEKGGDALTTAEAYPILINGQTLSQYFSEITTIEAEEGFVVISGTPNDTYKKEILVILYLDNGVWQFYSIENKDESGNSFTGQINQAMFLGGYYYFLGGDTGKGWVAAVEVDTLKSMKQGDFLTTCKDSATITKIVTTSADGTQTTTVSKPTAVYCDTDTALYALGGRVTDG